MDCEFEFTEKYGVFPTTILTPRLRLTKLSAGEISVKELFDFYSRPEVEEMTEWVRFDPHETIGETKQFIDSVDREWLNGEVAQYAISVRDLEQEQEWPLIGTASIRCDWGRKSADFGIWLDKQYWGRGFSSERGEACLKLVFDELGIEVVRVIVDSRNIPSQKAVSKYILANGGTRFDGLYNFVSHHTNSVLFQLTQDEYRG